MNAVRYILIISDCDVLFVIIVNENENFSYMLLLYYCFAIDSISFK